MTESTENEQSEPKWLLKQLGKAVSFNGKRHQIIHRRGAFYWLPVYCSSDIVHGSWWFVWGSLLSAIIPCVPLADIYLDFFTIEEETVLGAFSASQTWILLILSGLFYTLGSFAFVRAFEIPPVPPLLGRVWHCRNDELFGAWCFLLAALPAIPYSAAYLYEEPLNLVYIGMVVVSVCFVICSAAFVYTCYPRYKNHEKSQAIFLHMLRHCIRIPNRVAFHIQSDWLLSCWLFLLASYLGLLGSLFYLAKSDNDRQYFVWSTSVADCLCFGIGSAYYVAGSYPVMESNSEIDYDSTPADQLAQSHCTLEVPVFPEEDEVPSPRTGGFFLPADEIRTATGTGTGTSTGTGTGPIYGSRNGSAAAIKSGGSLIESSSVVEFVAPPPDSDNDNDSRGHGRGRGHGGPERDRLLSVV